MAKEGTGVVRSKEWREHLRRLLDDGVEHDWAISWADSFTRKDKHHISYYEAGFRYYWLVETIKRYSSLTLQEVVNAKKLLTEAGMKEREAEELLTFFVDEPDFWKKVEISAHLYKNGIKNEFFLWKVHKYGFSWKEMKELALVLMEKGFRKQEAFYEILHIKEDYENIQLNRNNLKNIVEEAQKAGFVTPYLAYLSGRRKIDKATVQEEVNTYKAIGLSPVQAEWWTRKVIMYGPLDKEKVIKLAKTIGDSNSFVIDKALFVLKNTSDLFWEKLLEWYGTPELREDALDWIKHEYSLEDAKEWNKWKLGIYKTNQLRAKGVSPKEFSQLLELIDGNAYNLFDWLAQEEPERIKRWLALGIKKYSTYNDLASKGLKLEDVEELLKFASLEEILEVVNESEDRELSVEEVKKALVRKAVERTGLKSFKLKM